MEHHELVCDNCGKSTPKAVSDTYPRPFQYITLSGLEEDCENHFCSERCFFIWVAKRLEERKGKEFNQPS